MQVQHRGHRVLRVLCALLNQKIMTDKEVKAIVKEVLDAAVPTMAEAIAKAMAKYVTTSAQVATQSTQSAQSEQTEGIVVFQYSSKCVAVVGFPKADNEKIKSIKGCFKCVPLRAYEDGEHRGWLINKNHTPEEIAQTIASWGYEVSIGASTVERYEELKALDMAAKTSEAKTGAIVGTASNGAKVVVAEVEHHDVEDIEDAEIVEEVADETPQNNVVPLVNLDVDTYEGDVCLFDGTWLREVEVAQIPTLREAYHMEHEDDDLLLLHLGNNKFLQIGFAQTEDGKSLAEGGKLKLHDKYSSLAAKGYYQAYMDGDVKKILPYICDAYREAGRADIADYLATKVAG